jgi:CheY-like chemotaxis protein
MSSVPEADRAVVVVDDEPIISMGLRYELKSYLPPGVRVETAGDGTEALELLKDLEDSGTRVPVMISDWKMPGMSGTELLGTVHKLYPHTALIMLSGKIENDDAPTVPHRFFSKPWKKELLQATVMTALE